MRSFLVAAVLAAAVEVHSADHLESDDLREEEALVEVSQGAQVAALQAQIRQQVAAIAVTHQELEAARALHRAPRKLKADSAAAALRDLEHVVAVGSAAQNPALLEVAQKVKEHYQTFTANYEPPSCAPPAYDSAESCHLYFGCPVFDRCESGLDIEPETMIARLKIAPGYWLANKGEHTTAIENMHVPEWRAAIRGVFGTCVGCPENAEKAFKDAVRDMMTDMQKGFKYGLFGEGNKYSKYESAHGSWPRRILRAIMVGEGEADLNPFFDGVYDSKKKGEAQILHAGPAPLPKALAKKAAQEFGELLAEAAKNNGLF